MRNLMTKYSPMRQATPSMGIIRTQFSPDSKIVLGTDGAGNVSAWDISSGRLLRTFQNTAKDKPVQFINSGAETLVTLASAGEPVTYHVEMWKTGSNETPLSLEGVPSLPTHLIAIGKSGLIAAGTKSGSVYVWEANSGRLSLEFPGENAAVRSIAVSHDGNKIAALYKGGKLKIWDVQLNVLYQAIDLPSGLSGSVSYAAGSDDLVVVQNHSVTIFARYKL